MESISSGVNFLRRRFSSQEIDDSDKGLPPGTAHPVNPNATFEAVPQPQAHPPPPVSYSQSPNNFSFSGFANKVTSAISAPTSPLKQPQSVYSQVQGLTKNLFQAASGATSTWTQPTGEHKSILIIDDQQIDWSKYFRNNRTGWQLRIEQASFPSLHVCCQSNKNCVVQISSNDNEKRMIKPDFALIRQVAKNEKGDYTGVVIALIRGGVQMLNSKDSILAFLNKNLVFDRLHQLCARMDTNSMQLIDQTYYPNFKLFTDFERLPVVVRAGNGTHGLGKMKIDDRTSLLEFQGFLQSIRPIEVTTEPFVDTKYDIHIQKIGTEMKGFIRKSISNDWKSNTGAAVLEKIALTERQKQWLTVIAECFGCCDVVGIDILVDKEGCEIIHDVNDVITLLGDTQEEDRRAMADLIQNRIIHCNGPTSQAHGPSGRQFVSAQSPPPPPPRPSSASFSRSSTFENRTGDQHTNGNDRSSAKNSIDMQRQQQPRPLSKSVSKESTASSTAHPDDTMGQLKRTFAGIFGEVQ